MKTLLVLGTHFIYEAVISEYRKMKNTPNVDAVLMIDNTNLKFDFKSRVEDKNFFDTNCKCFFFDSRINDEMNLPHFIENGNENFGRTTLHHADSRFYYLRKFFPDYDYYWLIEYDVFCNAETYEGFLDKFADNRADLLIQSLQKGEKNSSDYYKGLDWIYSDADKIYAGLFAVVRLSARAIDFLYKRRLEQKEIFQNSIEQNKRWTYCEIFVPTELMNGGFSCENLNEERVNFLPNIYLNDERIFLKPDNHLYHPVKSVKAEVSKLKKQYDNIFFCCRKLFLTALAEKLISSSAVNLKDFPLKFDENFKSMVIDLQGGSLRCEAWFINETLYAAVVFEGEYLKYFKLMEQYIDLSQMNSVQILQSSKGKMLAYNTAKLDNVSQVANVLNIFIEMTFTILQEKNL